MDRKQAEEFVHMLDSTWQPPLTEVQKALWLDLCLPLHPKVAFGTLMSLFKTDTRRPSPPTFKEVYRRALIDSTPLHLSEQEQPEEELPGWVKGWWLARLEDDFRPWPEAKEGYRRLHDAHMERVGPALARRHGWRSGYEWDEERVMSQADRLEYIRRAEAGEGPRSPEELASALAGAAAPRESPSA